MRRGLVHALAWSLATGAAVTLSWWGVHTVMAGTAYDPPRALPLSSADRPLSSSTQRGAPPSFPVGPAPSAAPPSPSVPPSREPSPAVSSAAAPGPSGSAGGRSGAKRSGARGTGSGSVESRTVAGGRVAFDLGASSAELVSATPAPGWRMQVWKQEFWIRVTFTRDGREVNVFCTWHDHAPAIEVDER
ncbi:hypothetical protein LG634_23985 [Streptomyces bambusae]|uniref:hypothetical protein n=1 Tax=Streptomyces bambusae TaxID=1550616 RepID=UPI001CFE946A|nr:hypothetical protein [Streptomyces bambusae]MCB5167879.1 hypothetical protein [Streptomyces bambusae]